jgi:hypothetical protein
MKRFSLLLISAALGAALLASGPAEARGGGFGGGHGGGIGGGHLGAANTVHGGMVTGRSAAVGGIHPGGYHGRNFRRFGYPYGYDPGLSSPYAFGCNPYSMYGCAYPYTYPY